MREFGELESAIMDVIWSQDRPCLVREVRERLHYGRPVAYTTVMTTLDRLYKKGLLSRRKSDRAFNYSPRVSRRDWEHNRAAQFFAGFFAAPEPSHELLVSCLVDAAGQQDERLLDELERKIRLKREELGREGKP